MMRSWTIPLLKITVGRKTAWLPPSMNKRIHWAERNNWTKAAHEMIFWAVREAKVPKLNRAIITITSQMCHPPDLDGVAQSAKPWIDGLVLAEVLPDDDPEHLTELRLRSLKVPHRALEQVILEIQEI